MSKTEKVIVAGSPELAQALQALHPEVQEVVVGRATPEAVEGKYVIGSLPPHLAERAAVVEAPSFAFAPEDRGKTLSADELLARYRGSSTLVTFGQKDLEEAAKHEGPLYQHLAEAFQRAKEGADLVVTRHGGLVDFLREHGVVGEGVEVRSHIASPEEVRGKVVAGILPPHLAKEAEAVISPPPVEAGRDRELTAKEMEEALRAKGIEPPGTQVAVVRGLKDPEFQRLLAATPAPSGEASGLAAKVEAIKGAVAVEVESEQVREALQSLRDALPRMVYDGHHGYPFPAYERIESILEGAMAGEQNGKASFTVAEWQSLQEALSRYPQEAMADGANYWAAQPPEALGRLADEVGARFLGEAERGRDIEPA